MDKVDNEFMALQTKYNVKKPFVILGNQVWKRVLKRTYETGSRLEESCSTPQYEFRGLRLPR